MRRLIPGILLLALTAGAAGCDDNNQVTTPNTPTTPTTPATVTETFTGTLTKNGALTSTFTATASGTVTATLTSIDDATLPVGLSLGAWTGSACQVAGISNDTAVQGAAVSGTVTAAASLCVRIYDAAARVTTPLNYTITVVHP